MTSLHSDMTVNEVIRCFPESVEVFDRFGIESCCGGEIPLLEAAARDRIDEDALLDALRAVIRAS